METKIVQYIEIRLPGSEGDFSLLTLEDAKDLYQNLKVVLDTLEPKKGKRLGKGVIELSIRQFIRTLPDDQQFDIQAIRAFLTTSNLKTADSKIYATVHKLIKDGTIQVISKGAPPTKGARAKKGTFRKRKA